MVTYISQSDQAGPSNPQPPAGSLSSSAPSNFQNPSEVPFAKAAATARPQAFGVSLSELLQQAGADPHLDRRGVRGRAQAHARPNISG